MSDRRSPHERDREPTRVRRQTTGSGPTAGSDADGSSGGASTDGTAIASRSDSGRSPAEAGLGSVAMTALKIVVDAIAVLALVLLLTLVALRTGIPRAAFYGLVAVSVGGYVFITRPWLSN